MRNPDMAAIVLGCMREFDTARYALLAAAVMPNHVHVVFASMPEWPLATVVHGWKSYTALEMNRLLRRSGRLWRRKYYDHIVRDEPDLRRAVSYVVQNPVKAGMGNWPFVLLR